ncbi:MAG: glycosyltransferase family 2 protein [Bacteroidales bacterium]|nr:glycosyltransferase family 2 protein [Bacteroidales bacterium]
MKRICIIIPCYNEKENLQYLNQRLQEIFKTELYNKYNFRILFVNDGSNDETLEEIKELRQKNSNIDFISFSRNFGHQQAIKAGIDHANADAVITMDADLQHPPELIPEFIKFWEKGYDVINSKNFGGENQSFSKRITSKSFYTLLNLLSSVKIESGTADFRLIDKKVLEQLQSLNEQNLFIRGIIPWLGFKQYTIEYSPGERKFGKTKYTLQKMFSLALAGITSFSIKPLRISIFFGLILSFLAIVYMIYALYIGLFTDKAIEGWTSVIVSVLFIGGLQLLMLGIIGEYLGKLFLENKKRPAYIINQMKISDEK